MKKSRKVILEQIKLSNLDIMVADSAGFCPGVKRAVDGAVELAREHPGRKYMYGEIVHNDSVVKELLDAGYKLVQSVEEIEPGGVCVVRAHGIRAEEEAALLDKGCEVVDYTCIWVKKIHEMVEKCKREKKRVFLCGDPNHPEVQGIVSRGPKNTLVLENLEDAKNIEIDDGSGVLLSQTTFSRERFESIRELLKIRLINLEIFDTICFTTAERQIEAANMAQNRDLIFVLGSAHSSNTNKLLQICQSHCSETYLIQRPDQILDIISGKDLRQMRIGITAGASTPERMIREVIYVMTEQQDFSLEKEEQTLNEESENQEVAEETLEEDVENTEHQVEETGSDEQNDSAEVVGSEETTADIADENEEESDDSDESSDQEFSFSDYIDGIPQLKRGVVVKGPIVRYDDEYVYVDVRDKSEGKVPRHEFVDDPDLDLDQAVENHEEVEVYVRHIKNTDMGKEIILSKARVDFEKHKEVIRQAFEDQTPVTVKVNNVVKDGVIATYGSVDLYIHRTQLELRRVDDLEPYRGKTMEVLITQFDPNRRRLRVSGSRRALIQEERKELSEEVWNNIEVGKEYEGKVRNITNFGAFVDIGGVDGLVHISELSWKRIKHPSEVIAVGDYLKVFVIDFDREKDRISLGFRREENDPYNAIEERFPMGSIVRGIVVRMFPFGAFIEVAPGVDALCHISQISNYHLNHPEDVLQVGMEVDARVLAVSNEERKISISIKEVEAIDPANPEDFIQHQRRDDRDQEDGSDEERRPRRRRPRDEEKRDESPTTYVDSSAKSSFASLADITISSKEGAEFLESLREEESETSEETTPVSENTTEEVVETAEEQSEEVVAETAEEQAEEVAEAEDVAEETVDEAAEEVVDEAADEPSEN